MTYKDEIVRNESARINQPYGKHDTTVHSIQVGIYWYYVHCTKVPEGYQGQVVTNGEFFCLVPLSRSTVELLEKAKEQIERVHEMNKRK
jgi:hypothetical protein